MEKNECSAQKQNFVFFNGLLPHAPRVLKDKNRHSTRHLSIFQTDLTGSDRPYLPRNIGFPSLRALFTYFKYKQSHSYIKRELGDQTTSRTFTSYLIDLVRMLSVSGCYTLLTPNNGIGWEQIP